MSLETEWPASTIQYRLNLPYVLHSISPALSALHASRAAALHPEASALLHPSHCLKCGTYHFSGDHPTYLVDPSTKKKRRRTTPPRPKTLQRRCHLCGFSIDARCSPSLNHSLPSGSSRSETVPQSVDQKSLPIDTLHSAAGTSPAIVPPVQDRQSHPKSTHTKASALRDMLSRNRQREEVLKAHKKRKEGHEGLAAFLKEL